MRSNPPFDSRLQNVGMGNTGPTPIHMPQMYINQMQSHQDYIQKSPIQQPMSNYVMQSQSPYIQNQVQPQQYSNDPGRGSRHQTGPQLNQQQSSKPSSVPYVQHQAYKGKTSQNQSQSQHQQYQQQEQQQYQQQYGNEQQQQMKNQQIIMFWQHKFYTILQRFQLIFQKVQWIRSQFYNLNNQLKAVDSQEEWNQAKQHHQDFMEQLEQFSQELAGVINQNASLAEQTQNQQNQHNIWKDRYFQLFQGYKTMQQQLFSMKQGNQDGDQNSDPKVAQILNNYRQLQRQYTQAINQLNEMRQSKDQRSNDFSDKTQRQKLDFAIRQAEKYKDTLDQLHKQNQQMIGMIQQLKIQKHNLENMLGQNNQIDHQKNYQQFTRAINQRDHQIGLLNKQLKQLSDKYNFLVQTHNSSQSRLQDDEQRFKNRISEIQQQAESKNMEILQLKAKLHQAQLKQKSNLSMSDEYQRMLKIKETQINEKKDQIQKLKKQIMNISNLRRIQAQKDMGILKKQYETKMKKIQDQYQQKMQSLKKKLRKKEQQIQNTTLLNIKLQSLQKKNKMLLQEIQTISNQLHSKEKQSIQLKRFSNIQQKVKQLQYQYNITLQQKERLNAILLERNYDIEALQGQINEFQSRIRNLSQNSQATSSKTLMYEIEQLTKLVQLKENQINKIKANISLKQGTIRQLENQNDRLKNSIITSEKHYSREKDALGQSIRVLQRKNQQNQKKMRQIQFEYGSIMKKNLEQQIKNLRIQNQHRQQTIIRLQAQQLQLRSKISHYQRLRSTHGSDLQELTCRIKQLETSKYDIIRKAENSFRDVKNKQRQNRQLIDTAKTLKHNVIKIENRLSQNEKVLTEKQKIIQNLQGQLLVANSRLSYVTQEHENLRLRRRDETDLLTKQSQDLRRKIFEYEHLSGSRKQFKDKFSTQITKIENQTIIQLKQQKQFLKNELAAALQQIGTLPSFDRKNNSAKKQIKSSEGIQYIQKRLFDFNTKLDQMIIKNKQINNRGFGSNIQNSNISVKTDNKQSQQQVKTLKAQIQQLRKYISKLQVQVAGETIKYNPKNQIIYLEQEKSYNQRIQFYQNQTNQFESRIQNLIQVNKSLKERIDSVLKDGGNNSVISFYKNQLTISEQTIQNLHTKIKKLLQQNRNLKFNNNQSTTKMCRGYQDKIFEFQNKIFILQRKISTLELEKNKYENERLDLQRNSNIAQTQLQSLKYSSQKQLQTSKKDNKQLAEQINKFENEIADLLEKVRLLQSQNSRLTQAVHSSYSQQHIFMNTPVKDISSKSSAQRR